MKKLNLQKHYKDYRVILVLVVLNIATYIIMSISGAYSTDFFIKSMIEWGACSRTHVELGQYWRLITHLFIHEGFIHLLFNIISLLIIGILLEPMIGKRKVVFIFLWSGIIAALVNLIFNSNIIFGGASAGISGLFGTLLTILIFNRKRLFSFTSQRFLTIAVIWFIFSFSGSMIRKDTSIILHFTGLTIGLLLGIFVYLSHNNSQTNKKKFLGINIFLLVILYLTITLTPQQLPYNHIELQKVSLNEKKAVSILQENMTDKFWESEELKKNLKKQSLPLLKENLEILDKMPKELPPKLRKHIKTTREYTKLKIELFKTVINIETGDDRARMNKIIRLNKKLDTLKLLLKQAG
ncbi:MAG: rhomboid family intramembrane serine protease [bacterium]